MCGGFYQDILLRAADRSIQWFGGPHRFAVPKASVNNALLGVLFDDR